MKAFVINLQKDVERRQFMEQQLHALGIDYEIIPATIGTSLPSTERNRIYSDEMARAENGHALSNTQIACADSHRRIYEKIITERIPYALVLEDDVALDEKIRTVCTQDFIESQKADWIQIDYVPFNVSFMKHWWRATLQNSQRQPFFIIYALMKLAPLLLWGVYEYAREKRAQRPYSAFFLRPLYLASAYIITLEGAQKLMPFVNPIRFAADRVQNQARIKGGLRLKAVVPLLAQQKRAAFSSNIIYDNQ